MRLFSLSAISNIWQELLLSAVCCKLPGQEGAGWRACCQSVRTIRGRHLSSYLMSAIVARHFLPVSEDTSAVAPSSLLSLYLPAWLPLCCLLSPPKPAPPPPAPSLPFLFIPASLSRLLPHFQLASLYLPLFQSLTLLPVLALSLSLPILFSLNPPPLPRLHSHSSR